MHANKEGYKDPRCLVEKMKGVPCFILGTAPSINDLNLSSLDEYFTVGINRIFYIYDPTVLVWQDLALWTGVKDGNKDKDKIMSTKSVKFVRQGADNRGGFYGFTLEGRESKLACDLRFLHGRGSSGAIAYQFVHALGCDPIILVGMDCCYGEKGLTDFYGNNPMHRIHTLPACVKGLKFIRDSSVGRTILNCSKNQVWAEHLSLEEAIQRLPEGSRGNREIFQKKLMGDQYLSIMKSMCR